MMVLIIFYYCWEKNGILTAVLQLPSQKVNRAISAAVFPPPAAAEPVLLEPVQQVPLGTAGLCQIGRAHV